MHPNPIFRKTQRDRNIQFARHRSFGVLSINSDPAPLLAHIPFQLSQDGTHLEAHLVRSNPIVRELQNPVDAVVAVSGGDGYISPDWYGQDDLVPTWNYVAVHLRGTLQLDEDDKLRGVLERLSNDMEHRLSPKPVWTMEKMTPDALNRMMRMIVPISMQVSAIEGTWKLSQNKSDDAILAAGQAMAQDGFGMGHQDIAALMIDHSKT